MSVHGIKYTLSVRGPIIVPKCLLLFIYSVNVYTALYEPQCCVVLALYKLHHHTVYRKQVMNNLKNISHTLITQCYQSSALIIISYDMA